MNDSSLTCQCHHATLMKSFLLAVTALFFLSGIHFYLVVLWTKGTLDNHHFSLSKLGLAAQAIGVLSQVCTVGLLSLLSFSVQTIATDKFIRRRKCLPISLIPHVPHRTVARYRTNCTWHVYETISAQLQYLTQLFLDLHDTLGSLSGLGASLRALWTGWRDSRRIVPIVAELYLFWVATATLHVTMPVMISVSASNVSTPALVEVTTMPGNIINIGMNLSLDPSSSVTETPNGTFYGFYSDELTEISSSVPSIWEARNTSSHLPIGQNNTYVIGALEPLSARGLCWFI